MVHMMARPKRKQRETRPQCAQCNRVFDGEGWFCSVACDVTERSTRLVGVVCQAFRNAFQRAHA